MVLLVIVDDFSNNGVVLFVMNVRNFYFELIVKMYLICVEKNVCFLVDFDEFQDLEDLLLDDFGFWDQSKIVMKKYFLVWKDGFVMKIIKVFEDCEDGYCVY